MLVLEKMIKFKIIIKETFLESVLKELNDLLIFHTIHSGIGEEKDVVIIRCDSYENKYDEFLVRAAGFNFNISIFYY